MINNEKEYIICAAIHVDDKNKYTHQPKNIKSGLVVCGRRHHNCFEVMSHIWKFPHQHERTQGFLSSHDKFYNREDAYKIAKGNGQLKFNDENDYILLSEDIY